MVSVQPSCAKDLRNLYEDASCLLCGDRDNCWKESGKLGYVDKWVDEIKRQTLLVGRYDEPLVLMYTLLAMSKGEDVTLEDVHNAWVLWTSYSKHNPDHPSNIPFLDLDPGIQDLDEPFAEAIREVAREHNSGGRSA